MRNLILAGAAALAFTATPALADHHMEGETMMELSADQRATYDGWPAERRSAYDAWPAEVQTYYWTLTPAQTKGWWVLTDEQRVKIYGMTPEARTAAWTSIAAQMGGTSATATTTAAATTSGTSPRFVSNTMVQTAPAAHSGEYPPCKGDMQDNCVNPREAGLNYGNQPLNYWPGKPASEIDGPLPAKKPAG